MTETSICELCGKHFSREDSLLKHKRSHQFTEKFKCEHCTSYFTLKQSLKCIRKKCKKCDKRCDKICCTGKILMAHLNFEHICSKLRHIYALKSSSVQSASKRLVSIIILYAIRKIESIMIVQIVENISATRKATVNILKFSIQKHE